MNRCAHQLSRLANLVCARGEFWLPGGPRSLWSECGAPCANAAISRWTSGRSFCAAVGEGVEVDTDSEIPSETLDSMRKKEAHKARFKVLVDWGMNSHELRKVVKGTDTVYESETDNVEPKLHWLMNEYGFDKSQVLKIVQTYPPYFSRSLQDEVAPFLNVFAKEGYSTSAVKKMIKDAPWVLGLSSKFEPTVAFFDEEIGLDRKGFVRLVVKNPSLLRYSIDINLKPKIDFFKNLGLSKRDIVNMLRGSPKCLRYSLENNIKVNLEKLGGLGFTKDELALLVKRCPQCVARGFETIIKPKFDMLEEELGMGRRAAIKYMITKPADFLASIDTWKSAFKWFLNNYDAVEREQALQYLRKNPTMISYKAEGLEKKLEFARTVLRAGKSEVFGHPRYLFASFENMVMFRVAYLHSKLLDYRVPLKLLVADRKKFGESFPGVGFDLEDYGVAFKLWEPLSGEEKENAIKNGMYPWVSEM
ncbi:hypothetical protein BSKO_13387 [Bryopsis sp. KO-2023]|nr:hypothetical protein BSKO_13387 [Bryopsis sp. KO-2023]